MAAERRKATVEGVPVLDDEGVPATGDEDVLILGDATEHDSVCTEPEAAITRVFQMLGKRWTGLILAALMNGPGHFTELRRAVPGISERMLSDRLTELASLDLVTREVDAGPPLRVSYRLTKTGSALRPAMTELTRWAVDNLPAEESARCPEFD